MTTRHKTTADIRATMEHAAYYIEQYGIPDPAELRDAAHAMEEILGGMWTELERARDMLLIVMDEYEDRKCQFGDSFLWQKHEDKEALELAKKVIEDATTELLANEPAPIYKATPVMLKTLKEVLKLKPDVAGFNPSGTIWEDVENAIARAEEVQK